jgi:hypothetical protein
MQLKKGINMKKTIFMAIVLATESFAPSFVQAQGTLYVSNLGQTPTGSAAIGSDSWIAQSIITGTDSSGYTLNSIQLLMDAASGSPSGFNVSIYSSAGGTPQNNLGNLVGSDPSAGGIFTYTASGLALSDSTIYYVVVTSATLVAQGAYIWSMASLSDGNDQWQIDDLYYSSANGSSWAVGARGDAFQLAVYATPVPEPRLYALAGLGLACLSFWRRKQGK